MKQVFKYPLQTTDYQEIWLPHDRQMLSIQTQHGAPVLWALVDSASPLERVHLRVAGTGHPIEDHYCGGDPVYLGTFQLLGGDFIGHVFQVDAA